MNEFAKLHDGDEIFKRVMLGTVIGGVIFALYMMLY